MTIQLRDIQLAQEEILGTREPLRNPFIAVITEVDGSPVQLRRPAYTWVKQLGDESTVLAVYNDAVKPVAGLPVIVIQSPTKPFQLKILGIYNSELLPGLNTGQFALPLHAESHEYPTESDVGLDVVMVYQPALVMLKTIAENTDLTVNIQSLIYIKDALRYEYVGDENYDLTAYLPAVGNIRNILIYLDVGTNTIAVLAGTEVLDNGAIPIPIPLLPGRNIASAYVQLTGGQTEITTVDHVTDCRSFLMDNVSEPYTATRKGEILISNNGSSFEAGIPVSDFFGEIVLDDNGHIVVI